MSEDFIQMLKYFEAYKVNKGIDLGDDQNAWLQLRNAFHAGWLAKDTDNKLKLLEQHPGMPYFSDEVLKDLRALARSKEHGSL